MGSIADLPYEAIVLTLAAVYAVFALGLQLQVGVGGLLNFGQVGYMAVGAYTFAIAVQRGHGILPATGLAIAMAMLVALVIGLVTLRLRADFLSITAIAAAEIIRILALNQTDLTGGPNGIDGGTIFRVEVSRPLLRSARDAGWDIDRALPLLVVGWTCAIVIAIFLHVLVRRPWGRMVRAVREDEDAVRALGKNAFLYKLQALVLGAGIAGLSGVLYAWYIVEFSPRSFEPIVTFIGFVIVILAGLGSIWGTIVAAVIIQLLIEETRRIDIAGLNSPQEAAIRYIIVGVVLMVLVAVRPQGIFGHKREMYLE